MGMPSSSPQARIQLQGVLAKPLERIRAGARLIDAAAKDRRSALANFPGDAVQHVSFSTAHGPAMHAACGPPTFTAGTDTAADLDDRVLIMKLAAGEFVRLHDRDDFFHAVQRGQMVLVDESLFADGADDGAESALRQMGAHPILSISATTRSIEACGACGFITIITKTPNSPVCKCEKSTSAAGVPVHPGLQAASNQADFPLSLYSGERAGVRVLAAAATNTGQHSDCQSTRNPHPTSPWVEARGIIMSPQKWAHPPPIRPGYGIVSGCRTAYSSGQFGRVFQRSIFSVQLGEAGDSGLFF